MSYNMSVGKVFLSFSYQSEVESNLSRPPTSKQDLNSIRFGFKIIRFVSNKSKSMQKALLKFFIYLSILPCFYAQIVLAQNIVWKNTIHATQNSVGKQICTDKNNNVYITCNYDYGLKLSKNDSIVDSTQKIVGCLVSYNAKGQLRWALNSYGGVLFNTANYN